MRKHRKKALVVGALGALGCGGNTVDLGHGPDSGGWADTRERERSTSTPHTIYDGDLPLLGFALDGSNLYTLVYHAPTYDLVSCPFDRCRSQRTKLYSSPTPGDQLDENTVTDTTMAVAGARVFWLRGLDLVACPKTGCTQPQRVSTVSNTDCFATDGDTLYWLDGDQAVQRLNANADVPEQVRGPLAGLGLADHLVVGGDYLYVSDPDADPPSIHRVRKDGTGDVELVVEDEAISGLSAVGDSIYYPSKVLSGRVVKCAADHCAKAAITLAENQRWPMEVRVADDEAFWLAQSPMSDYPTNRGLNSCHLPDCTDIALRVADFPLEPFANPIGSYPTFTLGSGALLWLEARLDQVGSSLRWIAR